MTFSGNQIRSGGVSVVSAGIVEGELVLGLSDGTLIKAGQVRGPQGLKGDQGPKGDTGRPGQDGNTIHSSQGMPGPELGRQGDYAIDTTEWVIYGPKAQNTAAWGKGQPLLASRMNPKGAVTHEERWQAGGGRFFPIGGVSTGGGAITPTAGGLEPIIGNGQPLGANIWSELAFDLDGDLMEVTLYFSRLGGNEVYTAKIIVFRANTIGDLTVAWEAASPDTLSYTVDFDAPVAGTRLSLRVRSNANWEVIRGTINKL